MPVATLNGKTVFYHRTSVASASTGPNLTLLFIHGLGSSSSFYLPVIPRLAASGFSCLALDTPGSALSQTPEGKNSIQTIANDVSALLNSLGIPRSQVIVVGHSMGALVASELASGGNFAGMILLGPVNPSPSLVEAFSQRINVVSQRMEALADTIPTNATGGASTPTHHAFIRTLLLSQSVQGCPVLIIAGSDDKTAPMDGAQFIIQNCSGAPRKSIEVLSGVGHWHCIEAADQVAALIDGFANRLQHDKTSSS